MTNINASNFATVTGRLAGEPKLFENKDGSKTAKVTGAYSEEFVRKGEKEARARYVDLTDYVPADRGNGVYDYLAQGSKVQVIYEPYTQKFERGGQTVFEPVAEIKRVILLESKSETDRRKAAKADAPVAQTPVAEAPVDPLA